MWILTITILVVILLFMLSGLRVVQQYERGVIFVLGRLTGAKGPGLFWIVPFISRMEKVDLRVVTLTVEPQEVITHDNITIRVTAVIYFYVVDPIAAVINVMNFLQATTQIGQTTLRNVLGQSDLDEILAQRQKINQTLQTMIVAMTFRDGLDVAGSILNRAAPPDDDPSLGDNRRQLELRSVPPVQPT